MFNKRRILIYFGLLVVVLFVFLVRDGAFGLRLFFDDEDYDSERKQMIHGIIPSPWPVRYDSNDMMLFEYFVDRQSRRALKAYSYPDQQAIISYKDGMETLILETARLPLDNSVIIVPVPSTPQVEELNQDIFVEISNNVFYELFNHFHPHSYCGQESLYIPDQIDKKKIIDQRELQVNKGKRINRQLTIKNLELKDNITVKNLNVSQVVIVSPDNPDEFINFFDTNYYKIPKEKEEIIKYYAGKSWKFVIIQVKNPVKGEINPPIKLTFKTPEIIFPLKASPINNKKETTNINLFIFSQKETGAEGFYKIWQGRGKKISDKFKGFPPRLSVLTGIFDNKKIKSDPEFKPYKSVVWIIPTRVFPSTFYYIAAILWTTVFGILYCLEKKRMIKIYPIIWKRIFAVVLIFLTALIITGKKKESKITSNLSKCYANRMQINGAFEIYHCDYGTYPDSLNKLTPDYIKEIPTCPSTGTDTYSQSYKPKMSRLICKYRHPIWSRRNRKPVVFPLCGEVRVVIDDRK